MSVTAIIFSGGKGDAITPVRDLKIGGLNSARRLTHAARAAGCTRAFIAADALQAMAPAALGRGAQGLDVTIIPTGTPLETPDQGSCLLVPADLLVDQRIFAAMLADPAPCVLVPAPKDTTLGIAKVPVTWLQEQGPLLLDHGTFRQLIAAARDGAKILDIGSIDASVPSHRHVVPLFWQPVTTRSEAQIAFDALLDATQTDAEDWPARFIHRPVERRITAYLVSTTVTPDQITAVGALIGLVSAGLFSQGLFLLALIFALVAGILGVVDGQLARVKLETNSLGAREQVVGRIVTYAIYFGMAHYFAKTGYGAAPYVMAGALILFQVADEVQLTFFRRMSGKFLNDFSPLDRRFRLIEGGRNTHLWTFLPFVVFGAWFTGFCVICAYGTATFFIHQWRFGIAGRRVLESKPAE